MTRDRDSGNRSGRPPSSLHGAPLAIALETADCLVTIAVWLPRVIGPETIVLLRILKLGIPIGTTV